MAVFNQHIIMFNTWQWCSTLRNFQYAKAAFYTEIVLDTQECSTHNNIHNIMTVFGTKYYLIHDNDVRKSIHDNETYKKIKKKVVIEAGKRLPVKRKQTPSKLTEMKIKL